MRVRQVSARFLTSARVFREPSCLNHCNRMMGAAKKSVVWYAALVLLWKKRLLKSVSQNHGILCRFANCRHLYNTQNLQKMDIFLLRGPRHSYRSACPSSPVFLLHVKPTACSSQVVRDFSRICILLESVKISHKLQPAVRRKNTQHKHSRISPSRHFS